MRRNLSAQRQRNLKKVIKEQHVGAKEKQNA